MNTCVDWAAGLLSQIGVEVGHCQHVSRLAATLFEQTQALHQLGKTERDLLVAGALVHDIGVSVSYQGHHKHSFALVMSATLPGVDMRERLMIANLARYHRKADPCLAHSGYANLTQGDRRRVQRLAPLLRLADGLDRSHTRAVRSLVAEPLDHKAWRVRVWGPGSLGAELWAANGKKGDLFRRTYGVELRVVPTDDPPGPLL